MKLNRRPRTRMELQELALLLMWKNGEVELKTHTIQLQAVKGEYFEKKITFLKSIVNKENKKK